MKTQLKAFWHHYLQTFKNIAKNQSILTTMILSVFFYSFFYPTAYKAEHAEFIPIVVVDEENSVVTQRIIRELSHSPNVEIRSITGNFLEAQYMVQTQKADGVLLLPSDLSQSLRRGETGGIGLYLSTAYFLKTKQIGVGISTSIESALADYAEKYAGISDFQVNFPIHQIPLFNTLSGYGSYIFPAVAPLIIHQTIFLGLCMLIAGYRHPNASQKVQWQPKPAEFWGIFATALTIGCLGCFYLFGFTFWLYDYPRGGNFIGMLVAVPIFISSVIAIGLFFASYLDCSERAGHVIVVTSIPLFLLSGAAYPHQAMPEWIQAMAWLLPSTHGVQSFVQLNQMGASLYDVFPKLLYLSIISVIFLLLAYARLSSKASLQGK